MLRWTAIENSGSTSRELGQVRGVQIARVGRDQLSVPMTLSW